MRGPIRAPNPPADGYVFSAIRYFAPSGSAERRAVLRLIRELCAAELPARVDFQGLFYPAGVAWVRRVPGHRLWLLYRFDDQELMPRALTDREPARVDPDE